MPFRFSLESVLNLRKNIERSEELALLVIVQKIAGASSELDQLAMSQRKLREQRDLNLRQGLSAVHLQDFDQNESRLSIAVTELHKQLAQLEISRQKQLTIFQEARREREILNKNREEHHRIYLRDQARQEQKALDDLSLARYAKPRR